MVVHAQLSLLGHEAPGFDPDFAGIRRRDLSGDAWVDLCEGWLAGDGQVFRALGTTTRWQHDRREMYERVVDVPRLLARFPEHGPGHPILWHMSHALSAR